MSDEKRMTDKTPSEKPVFLDLFLRGDKFSWGAYALNQVLVFVPTVWYEPRPIIAYFAEAFILTFLLVNIYLFKTKGVFFVHGVLGDYAEKRFDKVGLLARAYIFFNVFFYLLFLYIIFVRD
ncbi:hypothetical protein [Agarivorans albus]|uniref:hypothetical protein n=1 Tax=Agarivorans albus TaxID=182262 RepID=UPI00058CD990|nr:hypothetical protein [Agarivorans albus]